jgi:hypothetical protein
MDATVFYQVTFEKLESGVLYADGEELGDATIELLVQVFFSVVCAEDI